MKSNYNIYHKLEIIQKIIRYFIVSAGVIFLVTGAAKFIASAGTVPILSQSDPIFLIANRFVLWIIGAMEIAIGWFCLARRLTSIQIATIAGVATCFLVYRAGLLALGVTASCNCLGHITDALGMNPDLVDLILKTVIAYLLAGSLVGLAALHKMLSSNKNSITHKQATGSACPKPR